MASWSTVLSLYTPTELTALQTALKAALMDLIMTGQIQSGNAASQGFSIQRLTVDEIKSLLADIAELLGIASGADRVVPNFNTRAC